MSAAEYHRILERQLRRLGLSTIDPPDKAQWSKILSIVSASYSEADADRYTLERSIDISSEEMRGLHEGLSRQARQDALTGLPNRSALVEFLGAALARSHDGGGDVAVLFVDLDDFKLVNDSLGHAAGDELLVLVAHRIRQVVRDQDLVARLGGDELVVVSVDIDGADTAVALARRIAAQLQPLFHVGAHDVVITASIGCAFAGPDGTATTDDLMRKADMAMYEAKTQGRCQFAIFDDDMRQRVEGRLSTEDSLRHAVGRSELVLEYQPIVRLHDQRLLCVEALLRWDRPGYGIVLPGAFIPIAEETQLITAIDSWVIRTACQRAAAWRHRDVSIAVNLSARDLQQPDIATFAHHALQRAGLAPNRLIMEITETTLVSGNVTTAENLERLQALGVQLAIDDFGTGYSSFASLRRLPAQILKVDRSFVATLDEDRSCSAIVGAIINMGHSLGLTVVAEGVEHRRQADELRALGCDAAQGYLFGWPVTAEELDRDLAAGRHFRPATIVGGFESKGDLNAPTPTPTHT